MKQTTIEPQNAHQRIDKFMRKWLEEAPLSFIYKLFRKKEIKVNGKWVKPEYVLKQGDLVTVYLKEEQYADFSVQRRLQPKKLPYNIIYEDAHVLILQKPKGVLVQGEGKLSETTLTTEVQAYMVYQGELTDHVMGSLPAPAHRLDRQTGGLIVYGKTVESLQALQHIFKSHQLRKFYYALVHGYVDKGGELTYKLTKDSDKKMVYVAGEDEEGMTAITRYDVVKHIQDFSLLNVEIITGRTHQIRVHMKAFQHPVVGDQKYGDFQKNLAVKKTYGYEAMFLHAYAIAFPKLTGVLSGISEQKFIIELDEIDQGFLLKLNA
jgi:23S rRNA pseudouridine955/2504/2580 synthase